MSLEREGEIGPERNELGLLDWPIRERLVTRVLARQFMPDHVQQSDPGFQELRMPDGSAVMEDLKPKRPVSSSTWQVADVTVKECWARIVKKKKNRRRKGE